MGYVFISYSRRQLYFAEGVALKIQSAGIETWFDLQRLSPGADWATALADGYGNCERLVLVASQAAIQSPYVQVEWETALHNGCEVIVVLAEAVTLPDVLRGAPVYDARSQFDRTLEELVRYLRGEASARHDPLPAVGRSIVKDTLLNGKLPFDIWLTVAAMLMSTFTIWFTTASLPLTSTSFSVPELAAITKHVPQLVPYTGYLFGLLFGLVLPFTVPSIGMMLDHNVSYEELKTYRWKSLRLQVIIALFCLYVTIVEPRTAGRSAHLSGYAVLLFPLITAYWGFWKLSHSPDILRWLPSGEADQDVRENIQGKLVHREQPEEQVDEQVTEKFPVTPAKRLAATYAMHYDPADAAMARYVSSVLKAGGGKPVSAVQAQTQADVHLIVVSNRTSKQWLLERNGTLTGQVIHILATNIKTPAEIQPVLQLQWVDLRTGRRKTLEALAQYLTHKDDDASVTYAMQIAPTGFDNKSGFPDAMVFVIRILGLLTIGILFLFFQFVSESKWTMLILLPGVLLIDGLVMRRIPFPHWLHKWLGYGAAWFASPAPWARDAIGNDDRKYALDLAFSFLKRD